MLLQKPNKYWDSYKGLPRENEFIVLLKYLCDKQPVNDKRILEDLRKTCMDIKQIEHYLIKAVNENILRVIDECIVCENCAEEISLNELKDIIPCKHLEDIIGKKVRCIYCNEEFIVIEEHIRRYYAITFKGLDFCKKLNLGLKITEMKLLEYISDRTRKRQEKLGTAELLKNYYFIIVLHFLRDLILIKCTLYVNLTLMLSRIKLERF